MHHTDEQLNVLRARTMRSVYGIWFVKNVLPLLFAEFVVFISILVGAKSYMSFERIMGNIVFRTTHHPIGAMLNYVFATFANTEFAALVFFAGAIFVSIFIIRDTSRLLRRMAGNILAFVRVT